MSSVMHKTHKHPIWPGFIHLRVELCIVVVDLLLDISSPLLISPDHLLIEGIDITHAGGTSSILNSINIY